MVDMYTTKNDYEEQISAITDAESDFRRTGKYKPYDLYYIAVKRARRFPLTENKEINVAREAARMTAYRFLSEIKKICPEHYEHFHSIASNEMPD